MWPLLLVCLVPPGGDGRDVRADDPWSAVDRTLDTLAPARSDGPSWGVLVRTFYTHAPVEAGAGTNDVSGFVFEDVDLYLAARYDDLAWRFSADAAEGTANLEDAWASWHALDWLTLTAGQFKPRVARSGSVPEDALLFRERTFLGAAFDEHDDGAELGGHYDQFDYWLAVTDGSNGEGSDHFWSARGEWALYDAAWDDLEGAYGAPNHLRVLIGATKFEDVSISTAHGGGWSSDLALTFGPYSFAAEYADLERSFARTIDVFDGHLITLGDGQPRSFTLSRRVGEGGEAAVRFETADDADSTEALVLGANWRPLGSLARFVADVAMVDGDTRDFSIFSLGVQIGSSGITRPFIGDGAP